MNASPILMLCYSGAMIRVTPSDLRSRDVIAVGLCLLIAGALFAVFRSHGFDDPYITYRYAANVASGRGFVYNPGLTVLSTTAPLYALLLAPVAAIGLPLPLVSNLICCLSMGAGGLAIWYLGRTWDDPLAGFVGATLYMASPFQMPTIGAETSFVLALVLWAFVAASGARWRTVAVLLGLATVARADTLLVGLVMAILLVAGRVRLGGLAWRSLPWGAAAIYALLLAPWLIFAQAYYGSPIPATLAAKRHQMQIVGSRSFGQGLLERVGNLWALPAYRLLLILALVGVVYSLIRRHSALGLLGWAALYGLAYTLLGVTSYFWYYSPVFLGLIIAAALGVSAISAAAQRLIHPRAAAAVGLALAALVLAAEVVDLVDQAARPDPRLTIYRGVGDWLAQHTPVEATVGTLEVGVIGYYSQRTIIDFAGLIQPEVATLFDSRHGYLEAANWATEHYRPNYLVLQDVLPLLQVTPDLAARCAALVTFPDPRPTQSMTIYQCNWGSP